LTVGGRLLADAVSEATIIIAEFAGIKKTHLGSRRMFRDLPLAIGGVFILASSLAASAMNEEKTVPPALNFRMNDLSGKPIDLSRFQGKVVLFVNVASKCGYTKQYAGLQSLYKKYEKDGFVIIGVPANEFRNQEPGTDAEIAEFCQKNFGVTFPMMSKVVVKGNGICPLYKFLTSKETNPKFAGDIPWNFEKFLIARNGEIVGRFKYKVDPQSAEVVQAIEAELKKKS
jgi:glutathione peroxidase